MMISRPLRVACGSGHPQFRQNEVEKLRAVERSKRATLSSPDNQRNACGKTYAFAEHALPVALRHREQWHFSNLMNGRSASNSTDPQRHPPRTVMSLISVSRLVIVFFYYDEGRRANADPRPFLSRFRKQWPKKRP